MTAELLPSASASKSQPTADPCTLVIFGASGDLTKRLLMPAIYNLACDGLLPERFALVGTALPDMTSEQFRANMTADIPKFSTRKSFDPAAWDGLVRKLYYTPGSFSDADAYKGLAGLIAQVEERHQTGGNVIFYLAVPPSVFGLVSTQLDQAGFRKRSKGWTRIIVEKPFGIDLPSALQLNRELRDHWDEEQIYRIDHYLGKETVQNLLAFRFSNGMFEPLWNKNHIDHIQLTVAETVGVEGRGKYYDRSGVLRDMVQNHMFQMLAYLCMEPPASFRAHAIRNEKAKLLEALRVMKPEEVLKNTVRGQYGPALKADKTEVKGYRQEDEVAPQSATETFAAMRLFIDNWRWDGVPIYLRSGKALWKRGTEIVVQFKKAPEVIFRETPAAAGLDSNRLIFHIQPDQGIEIRFQAKTPGPALNLQKVNMRFDYQQAFEASRGTGYEVLLYNCMIGDGTLFGADLVEAAWRVAQPILDAWAQTPPDNFPNYAAGTWGPHEAFDLIRRDGRRWQEIINRNVLEKVPLFAAAEPLLLHCLALALRPIVYQSGDLVVKEGDPGQEMYVICRGQLEVLKADGALIRTLGEGDYFGEISLLRQVPRTASIRALSRCDLFVLDAADLQRVLREYPHFTTSLEEAAKKYQLHP